MIATATKFTLSSTAFVLFMFEGIVTRDLLAVGAGGAVLILALQQVNQLVDKFKPMREHRSKGTSSDVHMPAQWREDIRGIAHETHNLITVPLMKQMMEKQSEFSEQQLEVLREIKSLLAQRAKSAGNGL